VIKDLTLDERDQRFTPPGKNLSDVQWEKNLVGKRSCEDVANETPRTSRQLCRQLQEGLKVGGQRLSRMHQNRKGGGVRKGKILGDSGHTSAEASLWEKRLEGGEAITLSGDQSGRSA